MNLKRIHKQKNRGANWPTMRFKAIRSALFHSESYSSYSSYSMLFAYVRWCSALFRGLLNAFHRVAGRCSGVALRCLTAFRGLLDDVQRCPKGCPALFNWLLNAFRRVSLRCSKPFRGYSTLFEDIRRRWCSIDSVECLSNSLGKHRALFTVQGTRQVGSLIVVPTRSKLKDLLASSHPVERVDLPIGALNSLYSSICYLIFWLILRSDAWSASWSAAWSAWSAS